MTLADDIRKAVEGWEPRCQWMYPGFVGQEVSYWDRDPEPCKYPRKHHGDPPDFIKRHVGPANDHPFTHDPALDKSPEALLVRALRVVEAAEAVLDDVARMKRDTQVDAARDALVRLLATTERLHGAAQSGRTGHDPRCNRDDCYVIDEMEVARTAIAAVEEPRVERCAVCGVGRWVIAHDPEAGSRYHPYTEAR